jgi:RHS repeat-associated protein
LPLLLQENTANYISGPGGMLLEQIQDSGTTGTAYYYHADQLGSVRAVTNQAGTVVNTYAYDAYGTTTASSETVANPFRYAGEYQDAETGLYYLRARYYDPATQQFLTRDPLVAATEQAYNYAGGSPLNATDPRGLRFSINDEGGGGGAVNLGGAPGEGGGGAGAAGAAAEEAAAEEAVGEMGGWSEVQREAAIADEGELIQVEGGTEPTVESVDVSTTCSTKEEARQVVDQMNLPEVQQNAARKAISKATRAFTIVVERAGKTITVRLIRPGWDGHEEFIYTISETGGKSVIQIAIDHNGNLVHFDPKRE